MIDEQMLLLGCYYCQEQGMKRFASGIQVISGLHHGVCSDHLWKLREKKNRKY